MPADILRWLASPSASDPPEGIPASIANALTLPPIHVDHVAKSIVKALEDDSIEGVLDVQRMRAMLGFKDQSEAPKRRKRSGLGREAKAASITT